MTQFPSPAPLDSTQVLCILAVLLIPFTLSGLSLINTGLGRLRSAAHAMLSPLAVIGVAAAVYFICGFAWQGYIGSPVHSVTLAGKPWSLIGAGSIFFGANPISAVFRREGRECGVCLPCLGIDHRPGLRNRLPAWLVC